MTIKSLLQDRKLKPNLHNKSPNIESPQSTDSNSKHSTLTGSTTNHHFKPQKQSNQAKTQSIKSNINTTEIEDDLSGTATNFTEDDFIEAIGAFTVLNMNLFH